MGIGTILGAGLTGGSLASAISGSQSRSGGSTSSISNGGSYNSAQAVNGSNATSWSNTAGINASIMSQLEADRANSAQASFMKTAMEYNSTEAQKQRDWEAQMANTIYSRSVQDMIRAGINPILAASAGLSAAGVGSAASANIGSPSAFMGSTFAEQNSASNSSSFGRSSQYGESWENSQSHSDQWSNSESGLATGLKQMATVAEASIDAINSSQALKFALENFGDGRNRIDQSFDENKQKINEIVDEWNHTMGEVSGKYPKGAGHGF